MSDLVKESGSLVNVEVKDLISRQAAIDYLMDNMTWYSEDGYETDDEEKRECITSLINAIPSVTQKTGRWLMFERLWYQCSECCALRENKGYLEHYCPNCGCRMVEPQESEG